MSPAASGSLTQHAIDQAFSRKQRQSNMIYEHEGWSITIINGKNTGALGVEDLVGPSGLCASLQTRSMMNLTQVVSSNSPPKVRLWVHNLSWRSLLQSSR